MRNYVTNGGGAFANFAEVIDYLKNTNNSVNVKDMPSFRACLLRNDGIYTLKVFLIGKDFNAYFSNNYEIGSRLTAKAVADIERIMDGIVDAYINKDCRLEYTEEVDGVVYVHHSWIASYADFEAFVDNFAATVRLHHKAGDNHYAMLFRSDPNNGAIELDNQKCLVTKYWDGTKWTTAVKKIVCVKLV